LHFQCQHAQKSFICWNQGGLIVWIAPNTYSESHHNRDQMVFLLNMSASIKSQPKRIGITLTIFIATLLKTGRGNPAGEVAAAPLSGKVLVGEISHHFGYQCS